MTEKMTKGMILAAGLGTRLRPMTNEIPKALVHVGGRPIIEYNLELLKKAGIKDVMINLHYLGEKIRIHFGNGSRFGLRVHYSFETEILGTGGGIKRVEDFFEDKPFVVVNCDTISDIKLLDVFEFCSTHDFDATLVVRKKTDHEKYTPLNVKDDRLQGIGSGHMMYTGVQVVTKKVLDHLPTEGFSDIVRDGYVPMLERGGRLGAFVHEGYWDEVGSFESLERVCKAVESGKIKL